MKHFLIFGTHPLLSLAEAKAVLGGDRPEVADRMAVLSDKKWDGGVLQDVLAGTVKLGDVVFEGRVKDLGSDQLASIIEERPRGKKVEFGLTIYGASSAQKNKLKQLPLKLKRALQERGHSVRWVTGEKGEVTPAAVAKAGLTTQGYDFCLGIFGEDAIVGLTTHVQDADAWSKRDFGRPFRDEVTGMLPPKIARIMVNLAGPSRSLLDPFCGGGTILMEADHLGVKAVIGSDIDEKQIEGVKKNIVWLKQEGLWKGSEPELIVSPADKVDQVPLLTKVFDSEARTRRERLGEVAIVTEGYLGRPLTGHETLKTLQDQKQNIEKIWRDSLRTFSKIQKQGNRIVCVWPVWVSSHGTVAVDLKQEIESLGYKMIDPLADWIDKPVTLTYAREGQRVKRNIIVLEKI